MKSQKIQHIAAMTLVLTVLLSCSIGISQKVSDISEGIIRMHVVANSDSEGDQACKLAVRDALLSYGLQGLSDSTSKAEAMEIMQCDISNLKTLAKDAVENFGYDYDVRVEFCRMDFPQKTYGDFVMPAGEYDAVKVVLGEGRGENWWCVMYPPLCVPVAEKYSAELNFNEDIRDVLYNSDQYQIQFAFLEFFRNIGDFFCCLFS